MDQVKYLMLQPTSFCNLDCKYCYLPNRDNRGKLGRETVERLVHLINKDHWLLNPRLSVIWHAGEPLALPLKKFEELVIEVNKIRNVSIQHFIQTNATLISDDWASFFQKYNIRIGVSIDGAQESHDSQRQYRDGRGSFKKAMEGISVLQKKNIPFSLIAVVTKQFLNNINGNIHFLASLGAKRIGLNFEEIESSNFKSSLTGEELGEPMGEIYSSLLELHNCGKIRSREIDRLFQPGKYSDSDAFCSDLKPFSFLNVSSAGDLSTFSPELLDATFRRRNFIYGNIHKVKSLTELFSSSLLQSDYKEILSGIAKCRKECEFFENCGGGEASNKVFENGTFASSNTMHCYVKIQVPISWASGSKNTKVKL